MGRTGAEERASRLDVTVCGPWQHSFRFVEADTQGSRFRKGVTHLALFIRIWLFIRAVVVVNYSEESQGWGCCFIKNGYIYCYSQ